MMTHAGEPPQGPTYSLREGYQGKLTLRDILDGDTAKICGQLSRKPIKPGFVPPPPMPPSPSATTIDVNDSDGTVPTAAATVISAAAAARASGAAATSAVGTKLGSAGLGKYFDVFGDNSGAASLFMHPPVLTIATSNYTELIKEHAYTLVCFFDPRSAAYKINGAAFEQAVSKWGRGEVPSC
jgi:hypothetical protein